MKIGAIFPTTDIGSDPVAIRDWARAAEGLGMSHVITVRGGSWFSKTITPAEAAKLGATEKSLSRSVDSSFRIPVRPVVTLRDAQLRVVTNSEGGRFVRGTVNCDSTGNIELRDLGLVLTTLINHPERGEGTRQSFQYINLQRLPSGELQVDVDMSRGDDDVVDWDNGGQLYLQAFVVSGKPCMYRISNELKCQFIEKPAKNPSP